ncbi:hypothetical protein ACTXT7_002748 [Hymenolepis weldensis]
MSPISLLLDLRCISVVNANVYQVRQIPRDVDGQSHRPMPVLYYGVNCSKARYYQPVDLATKDVVITTYSVLKRELSFAEATQERISRKSTRYLQPPSPLKCIKWWRPRGEVFLDEACLWGFPAESTDIAKN